MTRITAPELSPSPPDSPPPVRRSPAPASATPPSRRRHSPSPSLALTPSSASTSATSSRPKTRPSPKRKYSPAQWVPVSSHPAFALRGGQGQGGGGAAWDAAASRLFVWDPSARGVHRISVRIRDAEPDKDGEEVAVEAAVPSEMLMPEIDLGYEVTHITLNTDGSSLLLAGSHNINVLYVHERVSEDGDTIICRTAPVASHILPRNNDGIEVMQTSWHPFSSSHFGVLTSDAVFRLFDLSNDLVQPEQEFYLQPILPGRCQNASSICPVAFSYGSDHLWDRFSVFILFSDGSIFVLCPVVPFGSDYSKRYIEELYEDVNTFGLKSLNPNVVTNSHLAIAWLEATFPELLRQSADGSTLMLRARPYAPVDDSLTLQGPLCRVCEENNELEGKGSSCDGKAVGFVYSSVGKDSVLVTAWSSGQLQIDALADEIQPQWSIGVPTCLNFNSNGHIKSVAMKCDSNPQDSLALRSHRTSSTGSNVKSNTEAVWMGHTPPLLRLSIVDLALPKTPNSSSLSLFLDPLVPERFYCAHGGGLDMVTLHFLPFSYPEMASTPPSVHPVLTTGNSDTTSPFLSGFVTIADAYGHVQLVGITHTAECFVVEMKGWKEPTPLQLDIHSKSIKDVESVTTGMISKELISGPDPPILPSSSGLRSLTPDSIEGKSTLHHYIKVFHEHYVEYGHKVFIELKEHGDYVKTEIEDKQKRLQAVKQSLLSIETKDQELNKRIDRASKVYDLLEKRIESFKMLPAANKKPLSQAELEFKSQLDRFADVELDALRSSIAALSARMRRFAENSHLSTAALFSGSDGGDEMRGSDLINLLLPQDLLEDVLRRVGTDKRDLDACALVCTRWRALERATRRSARLPASGAHADEVVGLFADRFPALVDVSIDERISADTGAATGAVPRSRRPGISTNPSGRRTRIYRMPRFARFISPPRSNLTTGADGIQSTCLTDVGLTSLARGCKGLEKLSLVWCSAISSTGLVRIAENCKKLTSLDIQACYIGDPGLVAIGEGCKLLNNLNLRFVEGATDEGLIGLVKNCGQSLVSLGVATCAWMTDASLRAVGSHCPNLEFLSLEAEHVKNEGVISVAKGCRLLKTLKLQCIGAGDEALEAIGSYCSLLESLSLNNFERFTDRSLSSIAKGCKNLTDLALNDCMLLTDKSLEFVARSCKKIARLKINGCQNMDTAALEHIGRWCPGLLELSLIYCPRVRDSAFLELGRGCSLLRSLYLVDCSKIGDDAMCHIAQGCKNLTEISIRRGYEIGDKALISVAENCKSLKELSLQFCERVSDAGLAAIADGCSLEKLNLCGCQLITDKGLTFIARGCPDILFLDISVLPLIGDMGLAEIGEGCPQLKDIALSHCPGATDVGLGHLVRGCLQLQTCQLVYCKRVTSTGVATVVSSCSRLKKLLVEETKVSERTRRRAGPILSFLCTGL